MIDRNATKSIESLLAINSAVALLGPRQVGKTTLALSIAEKRKSVYLDLEDPADLAKLSDPDLYFANYPDTLIILDEVQRKPDLFQVLRSRIDKNRRSGHRNGQFLLLGSASNELLKQSSESLAGRISYQELGGFNLNEVGTSRSQDLWLHGGFPDAFLFPENSAQWREDFIRTYLERDIPLLGHAIPATTLRRFWTMLAHNHGQTFNASKLATNLDVSSPTTARYLDMMVDLMLVRRLHPWFSNMGKRLVKSPKAYVRDSGLLHSLLGISTFDQLLGHPIVGASWEGFVVENILSVAPPHCRPWFYRTSAGAEIDLILEFPTGLWAIEIKYSTAPKLSRGFYQGYEDLKPVKAFVVYAGSEVYPVSETVTATSLGKIMDQVKNA